MPDSHDSEVERAAAHTGRVLSSKWRLDALLGVGGMAAVYAATHRNGKRVAVKMLHAHFASNADVRGRFLREGYVANAVGHEGAVSVLDDDSAEDGSVFLVMELLEGETLEALSQGSDGKLPVETVVDLTLRLLDVLAAAHEKGIVHRDIKPENVFLTRSGAVKVLDFGIARIREMSQRDSVTQSGTSMGTPAFMPPEQARGRWAEVDARTDVWAVGATMFTLLTGRFVHEGETTNEVLLAAMTIAAPPVRSVAPDVPAAVADVVDRALSFEREARWADARAMENALRAATGQPVGAIARPPSHRSSPTPGAARAPSATLTTGRAVAHPSLATGAIAKKHGVAWAASGVGVLVLVAVAVLVSRSGSVAPSRSSAFVSTPADPAPAATVTSDEASSTPPDLAPTASIPTLVATDLPIVTAVRDAAAPAPVVVAPAGSQHARPSCNPPYEYDARGVKRWKVGCL
jgi:serine/threonine-protein kinase